MGPKHKHSSNYGAVLYVTLCSVVAWNDRLEAYLYAALH